MSVTMRRSEHTGRVDGRLLPAQAVPSLVERSFPPGFKVMFAEGASVKVDFDHASTGVFWISPDMTDLCLDAAAAMETIDFADVAFPADIGLVVFAQPVALHMAVSGSPVTGDETYVPIAFRGLLYTAVGSLIQIHSLVDGPNGTVAAVGLATSLREVVCEPLGIQPSQLLLAFCLLLDQPGLVVQTQHDAPKPPPGRDKKSGRTRRAHRPPPVRVVTLRPGTDTAAVYDRDAGRNVEWRHRWVVRGHWRNQPYPSLGAGVTRKVWIAPYLKGPADLPVLSSPKVIAVKAPRA